MITVLFSRFCILTCGILYPGYASFKTVRAKDINNYLKWMMYWIVFAIFTATESVTDIFLTWLPFYYELKVLLILWLLPSVGNGSSFIYKELVHPLLKKNETRVDHHLAQFKEKGQSLAVHYMRQAVLHICRGVMNAINKLFPNGILGLLTNNNIFDSARSLQVSRNIIGEVNVLKKSSVLLTNVSGVNVDAEEPRISRGHGRKANKTIQVLD